MIFFHMEMKCFLGRLCLHLRALLVLNISHVYACKPHVYNSFMCFKANNSFLDLSIVCSLEIHYIVVHVMALVCVFGKEMKYKCIMYKYKFQHSKSTMTPKHKFAHYTICTGNYAVGT